MFNQIQFYQLAGCRPPLRSKLPRRTPRCRHWRGKLRCGAFQVDDAGGYGGDVLALGWDTVLLHLSCLEFPKFTYFVDVLVPSSLIEFRNDFIAGLWP